LLWEKRSQYGRPVANHSPGVPGQFWSLRRDVVPSLWHFLCLTRKKPPKWRQQLYFHILLNLGRIVSYALVGAGIGALGSVVPSGQMAGIGSDLRRWLAILTGLMLIWFGLMQIKPDFLPRLPVLHPLTQGTWHNRLSAAMVKLSLQKAGGRQPLGMVWGLIPCGFLYAAKLRQLKPNLWRDGNVALRDAANHAGSGCVHLLGKC